MALVPATDLFPQAPFDPGQLACTLPVMLPRPALSIWII
jgi:hypothetical protein